MQQLRKGMLVHTHTGPAEVVCMVYTHYPAGQAPLVDLGGGLLITPSHPVRAKGSQWCKPFRLAPAQQLPCEYVYNCVLSRGHAILVGDFECVTLGHGLTGAVVADKYYGTARVVDDLKAKPGWDDGWIENESAMCQCGEQGRTEGEEEQQQVLKSWAQANDLVVDGTLLAKIHRSAMSSAVLSQWRETECWIDGQSHVPAAPDQIPHLIEQYCSKTNALLQETKADPYEVGAFCLWWVNAVHPFRDGNGRAARGPAYLVANSMALQSGGKWSSGALHAPFHTALTRRKYVAALQHANSQCGMCKCCRPQKLPLDMQQQPVFDPRALVELSDILRATIGST